MTRITLRGRRRSAAGFSLTEALLALLLLVGILAAVVTYLVQNRGAVVRMEDLVQFHGRGLQVVEAAVRRDLKDLAAMSPAEIQSWAEEVVAGTEPAAATVLATLEPVTGEPRMRMLTVTVEWQDAHSQGRRIEYRAALHRLLVAQTDSLTVPVTID